MTSILGTYSNKKYNNFILYGNIILILRNEYHTVYNCPESSKEISSAVTPSTSTTTASASTATQATAPTVTTTAGPTLEASFSIDPDENMRYIDSPISIHRFT